MPRKPNPRVSPDERQPHELSGPGQDSGRLFEDARHHPEGHPHPPLHHHPKENPPLPPRHFPHTKPDEFALNIDHGTHEDRPRPAKIIKKGAMTGKNSGDSGRKSTK